MFRTVKEKTVVTKFDKNKYSVMSLNTVLRQ